MDDSIKSLAIKKVADAIKKTGELLQTGFTSIVRRSEDPILGITTKAGGYLGRKIGEKAKSLIKMRPQMDSDFSAFENFGRYSEPSDTTPAPIESIESGDSELLKISKLILDKTINIDSNVEKLVRIAEMQQIASEDTQANLLEDESEKKKVFKKISNKTEKATDSNTRGTQQKSGWGVWDVLLGLLGAKAVTSLGGNLLRFLGSAGRLATRVSFPLLILNMLYDTIKGIFKSKEWNVNSIIGGIGSLLGGGFSNKFINMFAQSGAWAYIGAKIGSVYPGIGTIVGGVAGGIFGAIAGYFGGEKIAKNLQNVVDWVADAAAGIWDDMKDTGLSLWTSIRDTFVNTISSMKIFMYETAIGALDIPVLRDAPYIKDWIESLKSAHSAAYGELGANIVAQKATRKTLEDRFAETSARKETRRNARMNRYNNTAGVYVGNVPAPNSQAARRQSTRALNRKFKGTLSPEAIRKVIQISSRLKIKPEWLISAMGFETGGTFDPAKKNPRSSATGLIQFMKSTAQEYGTTPEKLAEMSQVDQLDYVEKYLKRFSGKMNSLSDVYSAILAPAYVGNPENTPLYISPSKEYVKNQGLDLNRDGIITKGEAASKAGEYEPLAMEMLQKLQNQNPDGMKIPIALSRGATQNFGGNSAPVTVVNTGGNVVNQMTNQAPRPTTQPFSITCSSRGSALSNLYTA